MVDFSSTVANMPTAAPRNPGVSEAFDDTADRDSATPEQHAGAHHNADLNEMTAVFNSLFKSAIELTIAGGVVTVTQGVHTVDNQDDDADDDLDTINGFDVERRILIRAENSGRTVTLKDGTGNLLLGGSDIVLDDTNLYVALFYDVALSKWVLSGGAGGGGAGGATTALDNLASVAINESLVSDADDTDSLGSSSVGWKFLFLADANTTAPTTNGQAGYNANNTRFEFFQNGGVVSLGTASSPDPNPSYAAGEFNYPVANAAPLDVDTGTNGIVFRHLFDDTTPEFVEGIFKVPADVDGGGTVTFRTEGYAVTADTANIEWTFDHSAVADSESWDTAYTSEISGDLACDPVQDDLDFFSFTETIANLDWSANDVVRFKLSRTAPTTDNLPGDYGLTHFRIDIPRA